DYYCMIWHKNAYWVF
nr:immunoglobulin light chain junction region [Macaca mulatta]MOX80625.1 immunoglobulin light chain junction region [Macaca mulatta]